jgi:hypothetical protein
MVWIGGIFSFLINLTNWPDLPTQAVTDLYRQRWQIETFPVDQAKSQRSRRFTGPLRMPYSSKCRPALESGGKIGQFIENTILLSVIDTLIRNLRRSGLFHFSF